MCIRDRYCCCDCPSPSCCESQLSSLTVCTDRDCNNKFLICFSDGSSETCVYSDTVEGDDSISFSSGLTQGGINNPLQYDGDEQGTLTVNIIVFDNLAVISDTSNYRQNYIDNIQVDIEFVITDGIGSATPYNGENGVISMSFGYGIRCAEGYMGNDCSTLSPMDCSTCNTTTTECPDCPNEVDCSTCNTMMTECPVCSNTTDCEDMRGSASLSSFSVAIVISIMAVITGCLSLLC